MIAARVGLSVAPLAFGWIIHQVRATDNGAEMRSRFFLNHLEHLDLLHDPSPPHPPDAHPSAKSARRPSVPACSTTAPAR